jgi:hypothetical protein
MNYRQPPRVARFGGSDLLEMAELSLKTALMIPPPEICKRFFNAPDAAFLLAARQLLIQWSRAHEWTEARFLTEADLSAVAAGVLLAAPAAMKDRAEIAGAAASSSCVDDGVTSFNECAELCSDGPGGELDRVFCLSRCQHDAINSIVSCLLSKIITVFA